MKRPETAALPAACLAFLLAIAGPAPAAGEESPYTGITDREIKALSPEQVEQYLTGQGMGFALAAELNGYPGPKHVLELAGELELTGEQRSAVQASFDRMAARAKELGREIVELERRIDRSFGSEEVVAEELRRDLAELADLQGELRYTHLAAHLETKALLTPEQARRYETLRGYGADEHAHPGHPGHGAGHGAHPPGEKGHGMEHE